MADRSLYASINDEKPRKLKGSEFLDTAERKVSQGISYLKDASQDREGIGDDLLRLAGGGIKNIGKVASTPGIKHALQIAGAPAWAAGQAIGAGLEHGLGVDPRYGQIAGEVGEWFIPGYGVTKLGKAGKLARRIPVPGTKTALGTIGAMRNPARIPKATVGELSDRALKARGTGAGYAAGAAKVTRLAPDAEGIWNVTKKQLPQLKDQFGEWAQEQYKVKGAASKVKRKDFGTIIVDGDAREVQGLTEFLERGGKLPDMPKVATRTQARFRRLQREAPPKKELNELGRSYGLSMNDMKEYYQNAVAGFSSVREAAKRNSKFRGEFHAGHNYPAAKGGPTTGRSAVIESGVENIRKKDHFDGTINLYAAQRAGIPVTWAEDFKMWFRDKKGLPGPSYVSDFTNKQREIIESIPWTASEKEVNAIFKKFKLPDASGLKGHMRDLRIDKLSERNLDDDLQWLRKQLKGI